ncbi:MAG: hypothetical protein ABEJ94_04490 [Halorientalis sp.]
MTEFASCYFCGTALDAQIDPYPVVPEDAGAEERPTVDLCPVCRRKLSKVLDVALSAAEGAEVTATPLASGPDPAPLESDHEDPTADLDGEAGSEGPAYAVEPGGEATAVEESEGERSEPSAESSGEGGEPRDSEGERSEPAAEADEAAASAERKVEADAATATDSAATENDETDSAATENDGTGGAAQPSILSTPAAQKLVKLLQNREFPVDREEIEVVASNAYGIPAQDCEDVIDALVSEGYVDERKGQLVRPEE